MSGTTAGNGTYDATIQYPSDGDAETGASVQTGLTNAANRDSWLKANGLFLPKTIFYPVPHITPAGAWTQGDAATYSVNALVGPGTNTDSQVIPIDPGVLHNGAKLSLSTLVMLAASAHGATPATFPKFNINRQKRILNGDPTVVDSLGAQVAGSYASAALYKNTGLMISWNFTPGSYTTIDTNQYEYFFLLTDESGAGSQPGNVFYGFNISMVLP